MEAKEPALCWWQMRLTHVLYVLTPKFCDNHACIARFWRGRHYWIQYVWKVSPIYAPSKTTLSFLCLPCSAVQLIHTLTTQEFGAESLYPGLIESSYLPVLYEYMPQVSWIFFSKEWGAQLLKSMYEFGGKHCLIFTGIYWTCIICNLIPDLQ